MSDPVSSLAFGLLAGNVVHVDEVENGLACGCVCPACGVRLIAKHGQKQAHHFAHDSGNECSSVLQTALHLAAKAILMRDKRMLLPGLKETATAVDAIGHVHEVTRSTQPKMVTFDQVTEEVRFVSIIPDIMATFGDSHLIVEVAVHHFVDDVKLQKIKDLRISCVEVDLSGMVIGWTWDSLRAALVDELDRKKWLTNPRSGALRAAAQIEADRLAAKVETVRPEPYLTLPATAMVEPFKVHQGFPAFADALDTLQILMDPARLKREWLTLQEVGPTTPEWLDAASKLQIEWDEVPLHLDIQVPGEAGFLVARKVWQAAIYAEFVASGAGKPFTRKDAVKWALARFPIRKNLDILQRRTDLLTEAQLAILPWATRAVLHYLEALVARGILARDGDDYQAQAAA